MRRDKPFSFQAGEDEARKSQLALLDLQRYAPSGRSVSFTPSIVSTGGTPLSYTLDPGSYGFYIIANNLMYCTMQIAFSSLTVGTAPQWEIQIPASVGITPGDRGTWRGRHPATSQHCSGFLVVGASGTSLAPNYINTPPIGTLGTMSATTPWGWLVADVIYATVIARVIDGYNT